MNKQQEEIKIKKYNYLTIFNTIRCDYKLMKEKELRLKEIIKEIRKLEIEMNNLFKN